MGFVHMFSKYYFGIFEYLADSPSQCCPHPGTPEAVCFGAKHFYHILKHLQSIYPSSCNNFCLWCNGYVPYCKTLNYQPAMSTSCHIQIQAVHPKAILVHAGTPESLFFGAKHFHHSHNPFQSTFPSSCTILLLRCCGDMHTAELPASQV